MRRIKAAANPVAPVMLESKALQFALLHKVNEGARNPALRSNPRLGRCAIGDCRTPLNIHGIAPYAQVMAKTGRTRRIEIRVTEEEHSLEEAAADALGISLSEFYRRAARESAEAVLAERSRIILGQAEARRFLDALECPERFEAGMARLAARPSLISKS